jgi:sugar/nucleoside kinase (ribokinase family)
MSLQADPKRRVLCAGLIVADHLCSPIDHVPSPGELVLSDELVLAVGGGAANAAVDLARLEIPVEICGKVGDDVFGQFARETLKLSGVDTRGIQIDPRHATSQTLIVNVQNEDRRFIHSMGANGAFTIDDLDAALAHQPPPAVLYIGYLLILPRLDIRALAERFQSLRAAGTFTVVDVACPGPGNYLPDLEIILPHTDVFLPNHDEAKLILGLGDPYQQARAFRDMGAQRVVITMGAQGSLSSSADWNVRLGAYPIPFVDGSGGGDAFDAGYIAGHLWGRDEYGCLQVASALGASAVRAVGTTAGVFNRAELDDFLQRHSLMTCQIDDH